MSSPTGEDDASAFHPANPNHGIAFDRIKDRLMESADGSSGSDAGSFSRTRSPDLFPLESGQATPVPQAANLNGTSFQGYGRIIAASDEDEGDQGGESERVEADEKSLPSLAQLEDEQGSEKVISPDESNQTPETPDDTPSRRGSFLSSPGSSRAASRLSTTKLHRPGALQPFERRFSARLSSSPLSTPRNVSPAFLVSHSRQSSIGSIVAANQEFDTVETPQPPWEVVRWTKLKRITGQLFSEVGRRNYGRATVIAIGSTIAIGTSKGLALIFDYHQSLSATIGLGTKAVESGAVTALAISADHSTIATGHANGHIFTWEISRPAKPFLHIVPNDRETLDQRKSDGHVSGTAVVHVGFLGTRHTALVSADEGGMAFSHLATRGLGAIGRVVKTTRLLGRYPAPEKPGSEKPRKPSSVLAFSPLPLGNIEQPTDSLGLTALLTPYLLVIVSTTPIAETQFKTARPKEIAPHSALSGCLAWFPGVKLKRPLSTGETVSKPKLVYCWSNILTILDIHAESSSEKDKPALLSFRPRSRWKSNEAIVAVQWLTRSVLGVLTISQRLIILEDPVLRVTDSFDLLYKHIFHQDLFSKQLRPVVEQLDEEDTSMHGVVADAFYMSFRAYKGRLFLLGFNDVSIGTLSNWADRLVALVEEGDYINAIRLATTYYTGDADKISVGLPEEDEARHAIVQEKLLEMISASLKYTFGRLEEIAEDERKHKVKELGEATFAACISMHEMDFLFEDVYEAFEDASYEQAFLEVLEPYVFDEDITSIPPTVLRILISTYAAQGHTKRLEEMICRLDTSTLDLHLTTTLCKQHKLYDALIYVWNSGIGDYVTPLMELLSLVKIIDEEPDAAEDAKLYDAAMKLFPYLAYTLTSRIYPKGDELDERKAHRAKAEMYGAVFAGHPLPWPGTRNIFRADPEGDADSPYPYLSLILRFDTSSFMSMLNEAFEDPFLNGVNDSSGLDGLASDEDDDINYKLLPTRHTIISILLDVLGSNRFDDTDKIYLDIFLARNLPKYPQFIVLPGTTLRNVLEGLCRYPADELAEDCQLSVEYLLSFYHPPDLPSLIPLFEEAGFYRVLKSVYRGSKDFSRLIRTYFVDPTDREQVFDTIHDCLKASSSLTPKQRREVESVIVQNAATLASIDTVKTARTLQSHVPELIEPVLNALEDGSHAQFTLLKTILEPATADPTANRQVPENYVQFEERYVQLMCRYDPTHVADYIGLLKSGDLRLNEVLPAMEKSGVIDAAVVLMARDGMAREAMERLISHLHTLESALTSLISAVADSPDVSNTNEAANDLIEAVNKYTKVGIWLCQGQTKATDHSKVPKTRAGHKESEETLLLDELLWLELVDSVVIITKEVSSVAEDVAPESVFDVAKIKDSLRSAVQQTFSALLTSTARPSLPVLRHRRNESLPPFPNTQPHPTFLRILRAFLTRAARSSPSVSDLRDVLSEIFAAYTFEETLLSLANQFLDKDLFSHVDEAWKLRQRGWRPRGNVCERCKRRAWGPGVGGDVYELWDQKRREEAAAATSRPGALLSRTASELSLNRGKGKATANMDDEGGEKSGKGQGGDLVVFACRHLWHRTCLESALNEVDGVHGRAREQLKCPLPHVHA
ncbi:uncharacterized protein PV09_04771 [Verruconis gallopava]|uniref:Uncharacterized protein n=1 Tax=Verruconis gallopava TaxID=253628 RepID=A0A0D1XMX9_9PEZI|nr:uncharacterized protein PV09_04771 [Verruconis gallopava]KIW03931.1 hypothetical protein PV09_04771 [Verruconis gallopava]